ncbi:hypothetical protein ATL40_2580 [Serinibacter salmoneus]|uniref:Uncharacterized protein n=1 Tax=Serinibacter salmoneus TaxID=556530 RepID=A0A2A9D3K1_9MICO|nr:hypothetical protein ATL40_2580 [Serinibacter salmoneus]
MALLALVGMLATAVLALAPIALAAPANAATPQGTPVQATGGDQAPLLTAPDAGVVDGDASLVIIGTSGLTWQDVTPENAPTLYEAGLSGAIANLVVRSVRPTTCPADGWLALSSGARAADLQWNQRTTDSSTLTCRLLQQPTGESVPGWADYEAAASTSSYASHLGLFGDEVAAAGLQATAIGPGAAIALATSDGTLPGGGEPLAGSAEAVTQQVITATTDSEVVVVDAGSIQTHIVPQSVVADSAQGAGTTDGESQSADEGAGAPSALPTEQVALTPPEDVEAYRAEQVAQLDARVAAILEGTAHLDDATIMIASLADAGSTSAPAMQVLITHGEPFVAGGAPLRDALLVTSSTRQDGYVLATDLLPAALDSLQLRPLATASSAALVGAAPRAVEQGEASGTVRIATLQDDEVHAQAQRPLVAPFYLLLVIANVTLYAVVAFGLSQPARNRVARAVARWLRLDHMQPAEGRPRVLRALRTVSVALAAVPVSTMLANLLPWWRLASPALGLALTTAAFVAAVTLIALATPWRDRILAPMGVVGGITALTYAVDIVTGASLQLSAVMGVPVLVAGRFYGFNNTAFSIFASATILTLIAVTNPLVRAGRRLLAAAIIAVVGLVATFLIGSPTIGADFGGPPAIVPAFLLLVLLAAGVRLTWPRILLVLAAAVAAVTAFAMADYLRPEDERSHLGRFVETVLDGGAWDVVARKLEANLRILANNRPLTILAITGVALVVLLLARPLRSAINAPRGGKFGWLSSGAPLSQMGQVAPMLRPGLLALAVCLGIGFLVNDSGIAIPAYGVTLAVPLLLAACANWMLTLDPERPTEQVEGSGPADAQSSGTSGKSE